MSATSTIDIFSNEFTEAIINYDQKYKEIRKLNHWDAFHSAKKALKKEFKKINTANISEKGLYEAVTICGQKSLRKVKEWVEKAKRKEKLTFSKGSNSLLILTQEFRNAAQMLEEETYAMLKEPTYQQFRVAKRKLKKLVKATSKEEDFDDYCLYAPIDLEVNNVDAWKIEYRMKYWKEKTPKE